MPPLVSIIIPTYNRAHLIAETLDSVLAQTYTNWECIIVDDGSTDLTNGVIGEYVKKDSRFKYYHRTAEYAKGANSCRHIGFLKSKGDYINWFDSDDLMHSLKLETDLKMISLGNYDFTISQSTFFTSDNSKPSKKYWNNNLWSSDPLNDFIIGKIGWSINSSIWKKEILVRKNILFSQKLHTANDYEYHIKAIFNKLKPVVINDIMSYIREHENRLIDSKLKAPSKIEVNNFILSLNSENKLRDETIKIVNHKTYRQLCNLLKKKKIQLYTIYLFKVLTANYTLQTKIKCIYKLPFGIFFFITNKGYSLLN